MFDSTDDGRPLHNLSIIRFSSDGFSFPHNERFQILEGRYPDYQKSLDFENKKIHKIACDWKEWRDFKRSQKKKIP